MVLLERFTNLFNFRQGQNPQRTWNKVKISGSIALFDRFRLNNIDKVCF